MPYFVESREQRIRRELVEDGYDPDTGIRVTPKRPANKENHDGQSSA